MVTHHDDLERHFARLASSSPTFTRSQQANLPSPDLSPNSQSMEPGYPSIITLDIAGRLFKVSTDTLIAESGLFQRQLSAHYNWTPQRDGTYFLDVDPDLFAHLLAFMRRSTNFPLFWTKDQGFDYSLYQRLQAEAEYFQMDSLYNWIKDKRYLEAITIRTYKPEKRDLKDITHERINGNMSEDWSYIPRVHKTYVCPREIRCHYGNRDACGRACREYQGDADTDYDEEEYVEVVSVRREIVFDEKACQMA